MTRARNSPKPDKPSAPPWFLSYQPDHGEWQIKSVSELEKGKEFTMVNEVGRKRIRILNLPYQIGPTMCIDYQILTSKGQASQKRIGKLADMGVIPYASQHWHAHNYLSKNFGKGFGR